MNAEHDIDGSPLSWFLLTVSTTYRGDLAAYRFIFYVYLSRIERNNNNNNNTAPKGTHDIYVRMVISLKHLKTLPAVICRPRYTNNQFTLYVYPPMQNGEDCFTYGASDYQSKIVVPDKARAPNWILWV